MDEGTPGGDENATRGEGGETQSGYRGYEPISPVDFQFVEDYRSIQPQQIETTSLDEKLLCDNARTSKPLLVFSVLFIIFFLATLVWQILIAKCRVTGFCEMNDESSLPGATYLFRGFTFRVPSALVWLGLSCGTLGLLVCTVYSFFLMRKKVGTPKMVEAATVLRRGFTSFIIYQNIALIGPVIFMLILIGVGINWETAGSYAFGVLISLATTKAGMSIATRGNVRAAAAAHDSLEQAVRVAFRSGAVAGNSISSIALIGISAVYLMFADIQALAGFIAGASSASLFLRVSGGIFLKATDKSTSFLRSQLPAREAHGTRSANRFATCVGAGVGSVFGLGPNLFESFASVVIATAILGSNLPFFYRDSYAMCVYNHLAIDQYCGPFGYPEQLSYAVYICRNNNLYTSYPQLKTWGSNSAFVALPFVFGAAGLLVSLVCTTYVRVNTPTSSGKKEKREVIRKLQSNIRINSLLGSLLLIVSSAAICFGLFGPHSTFQESAGFSNTKNLLRMELQTSQDSRECLSTSLNITDTSAFNPYPVPQGGKIVSDQYRPVNAIGLQNGPANSTDRRLFGCAVLGIMVGMLITGFCGSYFTSISHRPAQRVAKAAEFGVASAVLHGMGNGLFAAVPSLFLLLIAVFGSHALFGAYGVGLMAVAFLSSFGIAAGGSVLSSVADNARGIASITNASRQMRWRTDMVDGVGTAANVAGLEFANGGAFLASVAIFLAITQTSGLFPSPLDLVGSPESPPARLIESARGAPLWNIYVFMGVLAGVGLDFLVAGTILLAARRTALRVIHETRNNGFSGESRLAQLVTAITKASLNETVIPVLIIFAAPLVVGFGFGQRALLAMLISVIGVGFLIGSWLNSAAGCWEGAERIVAGKRGSRGRGSDTHWSALYARDLGSPFKECVVPAMQCTMKTGASVSLVAITLMQQDGSRGWIGGIVLVVLAILIVMLAIWRTYSSKRHANVFGERPVGRDGKQVRRVSPFFEPGATVDPRSAMPGSQMAEALDPLGNPTTPVLVGIVPGLSDRSQADFSNLQDLQSPNAGVERNGFLFRDEVRMI